MFEKNSFVPYIILSHFCTITNNNKANLFILHTTQAPHNTTFIRGGQITK